MNMEIRPATPQERLYAYSQSQQISMQTGFIGYLRADMEPDGAEFYSGWNEFRADLKTDAFRTEFDDVINAMRFDDQYGGILKDLDSLGDYCRAHPDSSFDGGYCTMYAFRADTENHTYILRLNPSENDYNLYAYCFVRQRFDRHLEQAKRGIRFVTPDYREKFRVADGDRIRLTTKGGEYRERVVRYIDDTHFELGTQYGTNLYHIAEYAGLFEHNGCRDLIPLRNSLPETCYSTLLESGMVVVLKKGETGYYKMETQFDNREDAERMVSEYNAKLGVTKAQAEAMKGGSMFGFDKPVADPANYDEKGQPIRPRHRDRGDAR